MTNQAIARARLRNARLAGAPLATPLEVVRWFGAVQSQDVPGALWALAQRMPAGATMAGLGRALDAGEIVRLHALRPTWHFLAPDELRWIQALTGPRVHVANGSLYRTLRLRTDDTAGATAVFREVLAGGRALTRAELGTAVARLGLDRSNSLVITCLAMHAELESVICSGPRRGKQLTYQLVDERIPAVPGPPRARDDSLRDLVVRYFTSHGPATAHDASWWSGLTVTDVRRGIALGADELEERTMDGTRYWAGRGGYEPADLPRPFVALLSNYDEFLGSYADYSPVYDASLPKPRTVADVLGAHIVIRDGLVVGGWRRALAERSATITVTLLVPFSAAHHAALEAEVRNYEAFVERPVELRFNEP
ncbi:MAG TPA: winged helix DNA-binding domain-containing protein [Candidatus Limnocylindrales bacterium]|nr:winged helix DNA-binding domain-containing protein [Candidatus Limnocylindrales bacterium]